MEVLDFGLAKALDPTASSSPEVMNSPTHTTQGTASGIILGTAAYMAPEQARGTRVDKRADIWAFGVVLHEMLTGRQLFAGPTVSDTLAAVLRSDLPFDVIPLSMRSLVRRCLERDVRRRLRDIGEARIALIEPPSTFATPGRASRPTLAWSIAGMLAVAVAFALWSGWRRPPVTAPLLRLNLLLDTDARFPTVSPDGSRIVYTSPGSDGVIRLYTRQLDGDQSVALVGTEGAGIAFFSPDGQSLGFFADSRLKKIAIQGGGLVVLCDAPEPRGGSWGEDGTIVIAPKLTDGLFRLSSEGGTLHPATKLDPDRHEITHRWPQVLPGGAVLFTAHTATGSYEDATIEIQSLGTGERKTLVRGGYYGRYAASGHLVYVRQNTVYVAPMDPGRLALTGPVIPVLENIAADQGIGYAPVDLTRNGMLMYKKGKASPMAVVWLDSSGHTQPLLRAAQWYGTSRFSPDGTRLASEMMSAGNIDIWLNGVERGTMTRLTFTPGEDRLPVWSPDGKHLIFSSERHGGPPNLYWARSDGAGGTVRLTKSPNTQRAESFSPDGRRVVFTEVHRSKPQ